MNLKTYDFVQKTYSFDDWNRLPEYFAAEGRTLEECECYKKLIRKLDRREYLDELRETRRHDSLDDYKDGLEETPTSGGHKISEDTLQYENGKYIESTENTIIKQDIISCVISAIQMLEPSHQRALMAVCIEEMTATDYARTIGISPQAGSLQVRTARKKLKEILKIHFHLEPSQIFEEWETTPVLQIRKLYTYKKGKNKNSGGGNDQSNQS